MCCGVIAHGGMAYTSVDYCVNFVPHANWLFGDDLMRAYTLNWVIASLDFGDNRVLFIAVERAAITYLASGFGVERSVIQDDFAFVAGFEFFCALTVVDDRHHLAVF